LSSLFVHVMFNVSEIACCH